MAKQGARASSDETTTMGTEAASQETADEATFAAFGFPVEDGEAAGTEAETDEATFVALEAPVEKDEDTGTEAEAVEEFVVIGNLERGEMQLKGSVVTFGPEEAAHVAALLAAGVIVRA